MTSFTIPLHSTNADADRRVFPRKAMFARVKARRLDHSILAHRRPQIALALRDLSVGGLSALTTEPVQRGERFSFTVPLADQSTYCTSGRVLRCEPSALGWRIAVEFESLAAA